MLPLQSSFLESLMPGQLLEALFEEIPGAQMFVKDCESRFISATQSFAEMMGVESVEALIGKRDHDFCAEFLADSFLQDDQRVVTTGQPLLNKIELVPSGDTLDWLTTTKIPLYGVDGKIVGLAGITRITRESDALYREHPEMRRIVNYIRVHFRSKLSVDDFAENAGISRSSVERLFRKTFGLSPKKYLKKVRIHAACKLLRESQLNLATIASQCGFNDPTALSRDFRTLLKLSPSQYREKFSTNPITHHFKPAA